MRITNLVRRIARSTADVGTWLMRHMVQPRTTVEAYMASRGFDVATRRRWGSAVGRALAKAARAIGVEPVRERIAVGAGSGWTEAFVYPPGMFASLMETAWNTPDAKGRTYADKIG